MGRCQKPIMIRNKSVTRGGVTVPCGRCENCLKNRASNWSFRLMQEDKVSLSSYFITLTYEPAHTHITKNGFMDISKRDLQLFFKRFRKLHDRHGMSGKPLKYYAVAEYGGRFYRPHYHIIMFNADLKLLIGAKHADAVKRGTIELDGKRPYTLDAWPFGHITVGQVTGASVGYTMKYVTKPSRIPLHRNDDRTPEFALMSKHLGENYLTPQMIAFHKNDMEKRQYCTTLQGQKITMPRYYKQKMLSLQEKENLRAWNILDKMKAPKTPAKTTARERSEAYYAGRQRLEKNVRHNQKF